MFNNFRLGRCECLDDIWIDGEFDPLKIVCSPEAKEEAENLATRAKLFAEKSFFATKSVKIAFLNVRSLKKHWPDIENDQELNSCQLLGFAETWLNPEETIPLQHFPESEFSNGGKGKGVAVHSN